MRKIIRFFVLLCLIFIYISLSAPASAGELSSPIYEPQLSAAQVIAEINAYRQSNGIGAMQYNGTLAGLAQHHSEFMASTGMITHDEGSTSPTDRAYAAGGMTYFTAEIAFITGSAAPPPLDTSTDSPDPSTEDDSPPVFVYSPVTIAEPGVDGSVIHIVQSGQTLWTIAAIYQVDLQTVLDLNGLLSGSWVYPGDEILINPPGSDLLVEEEDSIEETTNSEAQTALGTAFSSQPQETPIPNTPPPSPIPLPTIEISGEPIIADPIARWMILIAFVIIFGVVIGSIFVQKPKKRLPPDDHLTGPY